MNCSHSGKSRGLSKNAAGHRVRVEAGCAQSLRAAGALGRCLPLAENGMVDQVGRSVHAAEGVVDRLVSDR